TLAGGFASTISWPATYFLLQHLGWKGTYLIYAAVLAIIAAPLHAFALPRGRAGTDIKPAEGAAVAPAVRPAHGAAFLLLVAAFALLALLGLSAPIAILFAILFGVANGLCTIARGAVPLALFGANGYGRIIGRIAGPSLIITAIAPVVVAFIAERASDPAALG